MSKLMPQPFVSQLLEIQKINNCVHFNMHLVGICIFWFEKIHHSSVLQSILTTLAKLRSLFMFRLVQEYLLNN